MTTDEIMALQASICKQLDYVDGLLFWKTTATNKRTRGKKAGSIEKKGYYVIGIDKKLYKLHRVIFLMHHGYLPLVVDHINGDALDNRIENLRAATPAQNTQNSGARANNTSGFKGVSRAMSGKWQANIGIEKQRLYLGVFNTPEAAHAAYVEAAQIHHKEFARAI